MFNPHKMGGGGGSNFLNIRDRERRDGKRKRVVDARYRSMRNSKAKTEI
jgi:hypothetical protein